MIIGMSQKVHEEIERRCNDYRWRLRRIAKLRDSADEIKRGLLRFAAAAPYRIAELDRLAEEILDTLKPTTEDTER